MATKKKKAPVKKAAAKKAPAKKKPVKKPAPARRAADARATKKKKPVKASLDRRKGSELQAFMDHVMTNLLTQYHFGLLQQAFEEGYKKGLEDGLKEAMEAADAQTEVSVHDLKTFIRDAEGAGIQSRKDDSVGNLTTREEEFLEKEED